MKIMETLPPLLAESPELVKRLRESLGALRGKRAFFPTVRVMEVTYRILSEDLLSGDQRAELYEGASMLMLNLLLEQEHLLQGEWRPVRMITALAAALDELNKDTRRMARLHLLVGLSPSEISDTLQADAVEAPLNHALALIGDRLEAEGFSIEALHAGGIGPLGDVTRVLERVRRGELRLADALAADYEALLKITERELRLDSIPGLDDPADRVAAVAIRVRVNPEQAPQNRQELRKLVSRIIHFVMIDNTVRRPERAGGLVQHEELTELNQPSTDVNHEDQQVRRLMLEEVAAALERIRRDEGLAIIPATRSLQDRLFLALLDLRVDSEKRFQVLMMKITTDATNEEIGQTIGISVAGVKRYFANAIDFLRQKLQF